RRAGTRPTRPAPRRHRKASCSCRHPVQPPDQGTRARFSSGCANGAVARAATRRGRGYHRRVATDDDTRSTAAVSGREIAPMIDRIDLAVIGGPDAGRSISATGKRVVVGTADGADLVLTDPTVSRFHCEVVLEAGRAV